MKVSENILRMSEARTYFTTLNYTLANEDTGLECTLLSGGAGQSGDTILTIAGSGGRVLPLLASGPARVVCVDLAEPQLALTELRLALAREASREEFLQFMGYAGAGASAGEAARLRQRLLDRLELRPGTRAFLKSWLTSIEWGSPLYEGKWERTFQKLSRVVQAIMGSGGRALFECRSNEEQRAYLASDFPWLRWKGVIALLGNASVFNALLYKGSFPEKNTPGSRRQFYESRYSRLFAQGPARENFFLQLSFLGSIEHAEGNPIECDPNVFFAAKEALQSCNVEFALGDATEVASRQKGRIGFLSFSDVPSYFKGEQEKTFMQKIRPGLADGATVVVRNYLHVPVGCDHSGYVLENAKHEAAVLSEKVGVYDVDVFRHSGGRV